MFVDDNPRVYHRTHRSREDLSASLPTAKLSNPLHTLTSLLFAKNPLSAMPTSRNPLAVNRPLGFGLRSFLNRGKTAAGIFPREEAAGGGCGGVAVGGGCRVGLKVAFSKRARAYASDAAGSALETMSDNDLHRRCI